jgi:selenide,water dikinase
LSVNGIVPIKHLKKNNTAQKGDILFLTKPLGVGILSTAQKRGQLEEQDLPILIHQLNQLNKIGQVLGSIEGVHAMTDITGFGLIGHLMEMAEGSKLGALIEYNKVPILSSAKNYLAKRLIPDATYRNWNAYSAQVKFEKGVDVMQAFSILPDPQTNGGLLIAIDSAIVGEIEQLFILNGLADFITPIGVMTDLGEKRIVIA